MTFINTSLQNSAWNGLSIVDPFNTPEAIVEVYVEGVSSLGSIVSITSQIHYTLYDSVLRQDGGFY